MRIFTKLRRVFLDNEGFRRELDEFKRITEDRFQIVFGTPDHLLVIENKPGKKIEFTVKEKIRKYSKKMISLENREPSR